VVSEATISDKSPLKQRLKRTRSGLQSVDSITPSKKDCSSTIKSSQSSQCTLTPVKVPQSCSSSSSAPKSKLSER